MTPPPPACMLYTWIGQPIWPAMSERSFRRRECPDCGGAWVLVEKPADSRTYVWVHLGTGLVQCWGKTRAGRGL